MPQTTATMSLEIGAYVYLPAAGLEVLCRIDDVKNAYGNLRYQIRPVEGRGSAWVNATSVQRTTGTQSPARLTEDVWGVK